MAENEIEPPALGVAWDGTGYGLDGTIWGGEFLLVQGDGSFERVAHFRHFRLPGGDRAIKEPRRSAVGLLYEIFGDGAWDFPQLMGDLSEQEKSLLRQMLEKQINAPLTSSVGRLFDAVAALAPWTAADLQFRRTGCDGTGICTATGPPRCVFLCDVRDGNDDLGLGARHSRVA
jgi:hydrogenase maturation factor HypF (carbamoyltransferase family)